MRFRRLLASGALAALSILTVSLASPSAARAAVIYNWIGTCTNGCDSPPPPTATATLTLNDSYVPGTALANSDFVSFVYSSSSGSYTIPIDAGLSGLTGVLPVTVGAAEVTVDFGGSAEFFVTETGAGDDPWQTQFGGRVSLEGGPQHSWQLVPEPSTGLLVAAGLLGTGATRRRSRQDPARGAPRGIPARSE